MSCFVNGSLITEFLPLCGCQTFLKASDSPGLQTCFGSLWTCAQGAGGPLHEVFCAGNACTCTGLACHCVLVVGAGPCEGVVVLKEGCCSGSASIKSSLFWFWLYIVLYVACHFLISPSIWKTFKEDLGPDLSPLILLK